MKTTKLKRTVSFLMAMMIAFSGIGQSVGVMATGEGKETNEELVLYTAAERTDLDADEVAEDINVLKDSDYDVTDVKDGISFYEDKVSVSYDADRSEFDPSKTGKYDTYYIVEPFSGKKAYLIHRMVSVDEPEHQKETESSNDHGEETASDEEEPEPGSGTEGQGKSPSESESKAQSELQSVTLTGSQSEGQNGSDRKPEKDEKKTADSEDAEDPVVGEPRKKEELPLSAGEIGSIQSNTGSFTIHLDADQDTEVIEEGIDPETGKEGVEEASESGVKELRTTPVTALDHVAVNKLGSLLSPVMEFLFPAVPVQAAEENKDTMKVSYSGYASYCGHRMGIKYISESGDYKDHLVYCMDMNKNTTNGTVTAGGKIKAQITFCLVNGARTLGGKCHTSKYSSDSASADYFITSAAIHVLNGEVKLSYYNDGSGVYKNIEQMVNDAKNLDKSKYNLETGLTKSITYTISPKTTEWKEVSEGLYKTSDKFVRTKSGTITDVKYKITGAPSGLKVGEINKDAFDIVKEDDLKKYDICVAQTDKDKPSSNFYLYANEEAMKKIIDGKITIKVQAKAYTDEKGGRKWTPAVV